MTKLATEFGIGNATVTDLKKNEAKIRLFMSSMESLSVSTKKRKIMRLADDDKVAEALPVKYYAQKSAWVKIMPLLIPMKVSRKALTNV